MSKIKKSSLGYYEILFIIPNRFTEDEAKQIIEQVKKLTNKHKGVVAYEEYWGKKKLAYPIKHNAYGYYALLEFNMERVNVLTLSQDLKLSADVLRYQIVSKRPKTALELEKEAKIKEKLALTAKAEKQKNLANEEKRTDNAKKQKLQENTIDQVKVTGKTNSNATDSITASSQATNNELETTNKKDNKDLKELDEKLEDILNADDLL